jgi:hypothetical protein
MISLTEFNALNKAGQADVLQYNGLYLNTRCEQEFIIDIYEVGRFYVEVHYHRTEPDLIVVKSFYTIEQYQLSLEEQHLTPRLRVA